MTPPESIYVTVNVASSGSLLHGKSVTVTSTLSHYVPWIASE